MIKKTYECEQDRAEKEKLIKNLKELRNYNR